MFRIKTFSSHCCINCVVFAPDAICYLDSDRKKMTKDLVIMKPFSFWATGIKKAWHLITEKLFHFLSSTSCLPIFAMTSSDIHWQKCLHYNVVWALDLWHLLTLLSVFFRATRVSKLRLCNTKLGKCLDLWLVAAGTPPHPRQCAQHPV